MAIDIQKAAQEVIDQAIKRHGGMERYQRLEKILCKVYALGGFAMSRRGLNNQWPMPQAVCLMPRYGKAFFYDYPTPGRQCVYDNGKVAETAMGETPVFENDNHRKKMMSVSRFRRPWTIHDATYFFGYAMLHYASLPYSLKGLKVVGLKTRKRGDWRTRIDFEYPEGAHTHSKFESIYFDETGLMVRHDYCPEVSSPIARAANFLLEYKDCDGYLITERRKVLFRIGRFTTPLVVLDGGMRVMEWEDKEDKEDKKTPARGSKTPSAVPA